MKDGKVGARSNKATVAPASRLPSVFDERIEKTITWISMWMFKFVLDHRPEILKQYIGKRANELALGITMTILDREGIAHCFRCPQRFALKKVGGQYACLNHSQEVAAVNAR